MRAVISCLRRHPACALALAASVVLTSTASAEIRFKTLEDGTRMIYNETPTQRARRSAGSLSKVPRADLARLIEQHAQRARLDPRLVQAVVQTESGYNVNARSSKGAMGLMQLMPETARELGVANAYDPDDNIRGGTTYLRRMLDHFGDLTLALAAYNAGPTAVTRYGGVPPYAETREYVRRIYRLYRGTPPPAGALAATTKPSSKPAAAPRQGARVYVTRDAQNRIVFTTTAPRPN